MLKKNKQNIDKTRQKDEFRCLKFDTLDLACFTRRGPIFRRINFKRG